MSFGRAAGILARAAPGGSQWLGLDNNDVVYIRAPGTGVIERFQAPALVRLAPLEPRRGFDATTQGISPDGRFELRSERDGVHVIEVGTGRDRVVLPDRRMDDIASIGAFDTIGGRAHLLVRGAGAHICVPGRPARPRDRSSGADLEVRQLACRAGRTRCDALRRDL